MTTNDRILFDLDKHLRTKIVRVLDDHVQLCRAADLDFGDVCAALMNTMSHVAASFAAVNSEMEEHQFLRIMQLQFRLARREEEADEAEARQT
jgi:hypothetical protein